MDNTSSRDEWTEASRGRWDTLIEVLEETPRTVGRLQVYIITELQGKLVGLGDSFGLQIVLLEFTNLIYPRRVPIYRRQKFLHANSGITAE